jgi:hypothetical protein
MKLAEPVKNDRQEFLANPYSINANLQREVANRQFGKPFRDVLGGRRGLKGAARAKTDERGVNLSLLTGAPHADRT